MSTVGLRPTFMLPWPFDATEAMRRVRHLVTTRPDELIAQVTEHHAMLAVPESKRHFWSPWLQLEVRTTDEGNFLFGRFSPHPSIWTGFAFSYLALGVLAFFSVILGLSQQFTQQLTWGYGLLVLWLAVAVTLWLVSQIGQRLSHSEMDALRALIEKEFSATE